MEKIFGEKFLLWVNHQNETDHPVLFFILKILSMTYGNLYPVFSKSETKIIHFSMKIMFEGNLN